MNKLRLTLSILALAALAACSKGDKTAAPVAPAKAAASKASAKQASVYDSKELAAKAAELENAMKSVAGSAKDAEAKATGTDLAIFTEHERARMALLEKLPNQEAQSSAMREVAQHAFPTGEAAMYHQNLRRLAIASMQQPAAK